MKFYKIKNIIFAFLITLFSMNFACAAVQVEDLKGNVLDAFGLKKTLPFTSWGQVPFDKLKEMTLDLSTQKKSPALESWWQRFWSNRHTLVRELGRKSNRKSGWKLACKHY